MIRSLIIIPAFNEEKNIDYVVSEVRKFDKKSQILIIDDGSTDKTGQKAMDNNCLVIRHSLNLGYGAALQTGFKYALLGNYDYIIQMDADGQHNPQYLPILLKTIVSRRLDIVIGSRFIRKPGYKIPFLRKIGMIVFGQIASFVIGQKITDPTSGFRVVNRKVARLYASDVYPTDFPDADVIIMLKLAGAKITEIPVLMRSSRNKKSIHQGIKPLYYIFKMFFSIFLTLIRKKESL